MSYDPYSNRKERDRRQAYEGRQQEADSRRRVEFAAECDHISVQEWHRRHPGSTTEWLWTPTPDRYGR